jgi:DNA polymerase III, gamma/tau subunits
MYQVIARKYRPQTFAELVGQEHVRVTLENAIRLGRIAHGYIFSGQRGTGKTTVARILARCLNCVQGRGGHALRRLLQLRGNRGGQLGGRHRD